MFADLALFPVSPGKLRLICNRTVRWLTTISVANGDHVRGKSSRATYLTSRARCSTTMSFQHIRVTLHIYWRFVAAWIFIGADTERLKFLRRNRSSSPREKPIDYGTHTPSTTSLFPSPFWIITATLIYTRKYMNTRPSKIIFTTTCVYKISSRQV